MNKYGLPIIVILSWGLWAFIEKIAIMKSNPWTYNLYNQVVWLIIEIPVCLYFLKKENIPLEWNKDVAFLAVLSAIVLTVASLGFSIMLRDGNTFWTASIVSMYPLITLILCRIFLNEATPLRGIIGGIIILIGVCIMG